MKVHELIAALQAMPQDDEVHTLNEMAAPVPVYSVVHQTAYGEHYVLID